MVVGDPELLLARARQLGLAVNIVSDLAAPSRQPGVLTVHGITYRAPVTAGEPSTANAPAVYDSLVLAAQAALDGRAAGIVTGPVQKATLLDAGYAFSGHTEFFRDAARADDVVMLLVAGGLRVALATTHLPLAQVPGAITRALLERRLTLLLDGLRSRFGLGQPRVAVAGLNPHAGEGGHLGREELDVIEPVCSAFRARGEQVQGPLPADSLFVPATLDTLDAVFAMYHDQGLPVLKHQGFGDAVNVTLGLPFVRTSVDHGTALSLAGTGRADPGSFLAAVRLAEQLALRSNR